MFYVWRFSHVPSYSHGSIIRFTLQYNRGYKIVVEVLTRISCVFLFSPVGSFFRCEYNAETLDTSGTRFRAQLPHRSSSSSEFGRRRRSSALSRGSRTIICWITFLPETRFKSPFWDKLKYTKASRLCELKLYINKRKTSIVMCTRKHRRLECNWVFEIFFILNKTRGYKLWSKLIIKPKNCPHCSLIVHCQCTGVLGNFC